MALACQHYPGQCHSGCHNYRPPQALEDRPCILCYMPLGHCMEQPVHVDSTGCIIALGKAIRQLQEQVKERRF